MSRDITRVTGATTDEPGVPPRKSERTRARILDAAAVTLSRLGYAGTRLSDVAAEAGVQAPAIYYYFESREELIGEVIVTGTIRLREAVENALDTAANASSLERIDVAIEAHLRQLMSESRLVRAVIRNVGQVPQAMRDRQLVEERNYAKIWRALFKQAQADGALRMAVDPEVARLLIIGSLNGVTEWWRPQHESVDTVVAMAITMFREGITAP